MNNKLSIIFLILLTSNAYAANLGFIIPGSKVGTNSGIVAATGSDMFETRIAPNRSMYCRYRSGNLGDIQMDTLTCPFLPSCPTPRLVGGAESGVDANLGDDDAIAFISQEVSDQPLSNYKYNIGFSSGTTNLILECFETTLFGNFNTVTVANPFNFLELSNDSYIDINTLILITKNDGTVLSKVNIAVPAGQQRDIAIHDIAGAANTFGRIQVAHDGTLDGLRAKLTKYTSSFVITASDKLEARANQQ